MVQVRSLVWELRSLFSIEVAIKNFLDKQKPRVHQFFKRNVKGSSLSGKEKATTRSIYKKGKIPLVKTNT